jgi:hypothetical protein
MIYILNVCPKHCTERQFFQNGGSRYIGVGSRSNQLQVACMMYQRLLGAFLLLFVVFSYKYFRFSDLSRHLCLHLLLKVLTIFFRPHHIQIYRA